MIFSNRSGSTCKHRTTWNKTHHSHRGFTRYVIPDMGLSMNCYCYILECSDGTLYTGWTTDPERRLKNHNQGSGGRYTRIRRPVRMVYLEPQTDRATAMKRERTIKRMKRGQKNKLIEESSGANQDLPIPYEP